MKTHFENEDSSLSINCGRQTTLASGHSWIELAIFSGQLRLYENKEKSFCLCFVALLAEVTPIKDEYIVFLLDSSSPVKPEQFRKEKEFIKSLAKRLYVGIVEKTFAAVVNYGSFPLTNIGFDDYSSFQEFERSVDEITPADGL